jgi:hypothetical protein
MKLNLAFLSVIIFFISSKVHAQLDGSNIPVRLSYFEAETNNSAVTLKWKTICFLEYAGFEIEKSVDGITYAAVHDFTADRLRCQEPFDYIDFTAGSPGQLFYRISVSDLDGKTYQSKIIAVIFSRKGFVVNSFNPTIIHTNAAVSISSGTSGSFLLTIVNMGGIMIHRQYFPVLKGAGTYYFSFDGLPTGSYQAVFQNKQGERSTIRFFKQ